jgi:serine/threonine protein kinase
VSDERSGAAFPASFSAGSRVAGYLLEEQIGQGGMAVVFRAQDERLNRQVALKVLAPGLTADEGFRQRFIRESRSAAAVDDPHIIPVFEAGEADGVLFIAMRYVPGGDVGTLVRRQGPLTPARAAAIVSAVASALDAAHAAGLVHRDVKPANMLVDARPGRPDHVYLSDFGLTKGALSSASLTGTGHFMGTLDYCAPEQIQGQQVGARTDEYALACAAFEVLSGEPPFPRDKSMAVLYAQLSAPPPLLSARRPGLPPAVDEVLQRALAKAPDDRFASCGEFADALRLALGLQRYDVDPDASPPPGHPPTEASRTADLDGHLVTHGAQPTVDTVPPMAGTSPPVVVAGATPAVSAEPSPRRGGNRHVGLLVLGTVAILTAGGVAAAAVFANITSHRSAGPTGSVAAHLATSPAAGSVSPTASRPARPAAGGSPSPATAASSPVIRTFPEPGSAQVYSVALSPDGKTLATGDVSGTAYLWDAGTGHQTAMLRSGAKVFTVAFSPDGALVVTGDGNGRTYLWQTATGQLAGTVTDPGGAAVNSAAFSPDGKTLATGDKNGRAYLWAITAGGHGATLARTLADPAGAGVWALAFSPDGKMLAMGDFGGRTYLWDVATATPDRTFTVPGGQYVTAVAFSPDGRTLATGNVDGTAYLWNVASGTRTVIPEPGTVWGVAFGQGGTLAIGDADGSTYLYDAAAGRQSAILTDPASGSQGVDAVAFSGDGKTLAAGDSDGTTYLWGTGT